MVHFSSIRNYSQLSFVYDCDNSKYNEYIYIYTIGKHIRVYIHVYVFLLSIRVLLGFQFFRKVSTHPVSKRNIPYVIQLFYWDILIVLPAGAIRYQFQRFITNCFDLDIMVFATLGIIL